MNPPYPMADSPFRSAVPTVEELEEMARRAEERMSKEREQELWRSACLNVLGALSVGLANVPTKDVSERAIKTADDVLTAYRKSFRASVGEEGGAKLVSLPTRLAPDEGEDE